MHFSVPGMTCVKRDLPPIAWGRLLSQTPLPATYPEPATTKCSASTATTWVFPNGIYDPLGLSRIQRARAMDAVALFIIRHVVHLTYQHPSRGAGNNGAMSAQRAMQQRRAPPAVQICTTARGAANVPGNVSLEQISAAEGPPVGPVAIDD